MSLDGLPRDLKLLLLSKYCDPLGALACLCVCKSFGCLASVIRVSIVRRRRLALDRKYPTPTPDNLARYPRLAFSIKHNRSPNPCAWCGCHSHRACWPVGKADRNGERVQTKCKLCPNIKCKLCDYMGVLSQVKYHQKVYCAIQCHRCGDTLRYHRWTNHIERKCRRRLAGDHSYITLRSQMKVAMS